MAQVTLGVGQQDTMLKLLSLKAWMKSRNLKKSDKVKILAAFNQINEGAPFDEKQVQYSAVQNDADCQTVFRFHNNLIPWYYTYSERGSMAFVAVL